MISKQRERWSDHEHTRFLEALKLYGRAWRRIEGACGGCGPAFLAATGPTRAVPEYEAGASRRICLRCEN